MDERRHLGFEPRQKIHAQVKLTVDRHSGSKMGRRRKKMAFLGYVRPK
jgi:hypothetical protein